MKNISGVLLLSGLFLSASAFAAPSVHVSDVSSAASSAEHQGLQSAYDVNGDVVDALMDGDYASVAQDGLNALVQEGVQALRDSNEFALADQFESEWANQFNHYYTTSRLSALDIGDHDPMSPWLAKFYITLFNKTKSAVRGVRLINDINTMNFALAVVFHPNGTWRTQDTSADSIEYRKHFIPMANIATYWTTLEVCKHYASQYGSICDDGASELEHLMGRYVAPRISDWVFNEATGNSSSEFAMSASEPFSSESQFEAQVLRLHNSH